MGQLYKNQKKKMTNVFGKYKTIHLMAFACCYLERKIYNSLKIHLTDPLLS